MTKFILNVSDIISCVNSSKKKLNNYQEMMNVYLKNVSDADAVWKDNNTSSFIEIVKKDHTEFNEYIESFDKYIGIILNFCNSLKQIINTNLNLNLTKIEYNLDILDSVISNLDQIYTYLNENYIILKYIRILETSPYYLKIQQFKSKTYTYKSIVFNLLAGLKQTKNDIENLVVKTKKTVEKFEIKLISENFLSHSYKVYDVNPVASETEFTTDSSVATNIISANLHVDNSEITMNQLGTTGTQIREEKLENSDSEIEINQKNYGGIKIEKEYSQDSNDKIEVNQLYNVNSELQQSDMKNIENSFSIDDLNTSNVLVNATVTAGAYNDIKQLSVEEKNINNLNMLSSNDVVVDKVTLNNNIKNLNLVNSQQNTVKEVSVKDNIVNLNINNY